MGCLVFILIAFMIIIAGLYLLLRPLEEPSPESLLTPDTRAAFILNFDLDSRLLKSLLWRGINLSSLEQGIESSYEDFEKTCSVLQFFVYPRVVLIFQEAPPPSFLSCTVVLNLRRAVMVFKHLFQRSIADAPFFSLPSDGSSGILTFAKNSLILSDLLAPHQNVVSKREGSMSGDAVDDLLNHLTVQFEVKEPEWLIAGCVVNTENWIGNTIDSFSKIPLNSADSNVIIQFFSVEEWGEIPWSFLERILIKVDLIEVDHYAINMEIFFNRKDISSKVEEILRSVLLPYLRQLIKDIFVVNYYTAAENEMLVLDLDLKQTAVFWDMMF